MTYREFPPPADLASHVACTWSIVSAGGGGAPQPVIPDGCADIIAFGHQAPHVAAPAARTQWVDPPSPGVLISAIRLRPGAVRSILRCDAGDIGAWGTELAAICGAAARALVVRLEGSDDPSVRRHALESWVRRRIALAGDADRLVLAAAGLLTWGTRLNMDKLTATFDVSPRRLHRAFVAACGYGPRTFQRIMRLQRALRLQTTPDGMPGLAQLAQAAGYCDQAHMSREFQALTGFTPARYLSGFDAEVGRWLDG